MKRITLLLLVLLGAGVLVFAQSDVYQYHIDLRKVVDDKLQVELTTPKIKQSTIKFYMPKIIPGTYMFADYGRFVSDFKAMDADGNALPVNKLDVNTWEITNAKDLHKITYWTMDTFDADVDGPTIFGMSGTNFEAGENFVLDLSGICGYFEGMKENPFELSISRPENFYGSTSLVAARSDKTMDTYRLENYGRLIDSPMLYCEPDTATVMVGKTEVLVSVYYESEKNIAPRIAKAYSRLLEAQGKFIGELPVDKYAFLMHFQRPGEFSVGQGALEHSYSSLYHLTEGPLDQMMPFLIDIAAHEFFHILTPLNLHSEEIRYFNFNEPELSKHLWLYEGVTEYFAHQAQVADDVMPMERYLNNMGQKVNVSKNYYTDNLPFTEMSVHCADKHAAEYANVYQKGALIGMCLDIKLRQLSNGEEGLIDLMRALTQKYGKDKPFKDKKLFKVIKKMTYPEIAAFFETYVEGDTPIPYGEYLELVGINYQAPGSYLGFSLGGGSMGFNQETNRITIQSAHTLNAFGRALGYKLGDEIAAFNGKKLPAPQDGLGAFIEEVQSNMQEGDNFEATVIRTDESGKEREVTLRAKIVKVELTSEAELSLNPNATPEQLALRQAWINSSIRP